LSTSPPRNPRFSVASHRSRAILYKNSFNLKLCINEVYCANALLSLIKITLCSKLHRQKVLDRNSFPTRSRNSFELQVQNLDLSVGTHLATLEAAPVPRACWLAAVDFDRLRFFFMFPPGSRRRPQRCGASLDALTLLSDVITSTKILSLRDMVTDPMSRTRWCLRADSCLTITL